MSAKSNRLFLVLFVISGACGLVYEVVWTRLFTVVIGNTVFSVSAILTVFMAGLALGSRIAGRALDRKPFPLIPAYAALEAGIALYNLLLPFLIKAADPLFRLIYVQGSEPQLLVGRLLIVFVLLIVPASLMGATLPILIRFYADSVAEAGEQTGRVYAANTLGAALGAAAAGFLLVPRLGVMVALYATAALNVAIAVLAWRARPRGVEGVFQRDAVSVLPVAPRPASQRILLPVMFLSGFAALSNEVAWTRVLGLVVGPTTYAFTLMLCSMIAGLGIGAAAGAWWTRRYATRTSTLATIEALIGLASLALIPAFGRLPLWIGRLVARYSESFAAIQIFEFLVFFALMLVPTTLLGMTFPMASKLYAKSNSLLCTDVSGVYAFNTVGGIVGALTAGFLLIPAIGAQSALIAAAGISVFAGLILTAAEISDRGVDGWSYRLGAPPLLALAALSSMLFIPKWNPEVMTSGAYKYAPMYASTSDLEAMLSSGDLLYFKEGSTTTVSVRKYRGDLMLSVDGKVDATDAGDMTTQKMLAHLPLLIAKDAKSVAVIGLGSGATAGAALAHPIDRLDVLEISPEVVEASRFFSHVNHDALSDPRTNLIVGDGRNHLRYTDRRYDVIISEPSNPWIAGMAALFTKEFFRESRARLTAEGIHCQWFHSYNMSLEDLRTIIATFRTEFPSAMLWTLNEYDFLLIGSPSPITLDEALLKRNFARVAADLREIKVQDSFSVLSLLMLRDRELDRFAEGAVLNTDDFPVLEFSAPQSIHADTSDKNFAALSAAPRSPLSLPSPTAENLRNKGEMYLEAEAFRDAMREFRAAIALDVNDRRAWTGLVEAARGVDRDELQTFIEDTIQEHPVTVARVAAADFYLRQGRTARAIELLETVLEEEPANIEALEKAAGVSADAGDGRLAEFAGRLLAADPGNAAGLHHAASVRAFQGRLDEAIQLAKRSLEADPKRSRARNLLAVAYDKTYQPDLAEAEFRRSIELMPDDWVSYNNYGIFLLGRDRVPEAIAQFRRAISLNPENVQGFVGMGEAHRQAGTRKEADAWYRKALKMDPAHPVARQFVQ